MIDELKLCVTGSSGLLGSEFVRILSQKCKTVISVDADITIKNNIIQCLNLSDPDVVIHAAAYTDVEGCEKHQEHAHNVNVVGTKNIVEYCSQKKKKLVYISSTGVYGTGRFHIPHKEIDNVRPTTVHHRSKYEAELCVQEALSSFLIIRTGWLYGGYSLSNKKNFVLNRIKESRNQRIIYANKDQIGNPTNVTDLIIQVQRLIELDTNGLFNCVNEGAVTRFDYVKKIFSRINPKIKVTEADKALFKRSAPVSDNEAAENYNLNIINQNFMRNWEVALNEYLDSLIGVNIE